MDVGSPEDGLNKMSDYFKNDKSYVHEELDLDFLINKDDGADNYFCDDFAGDDKFQLDQSEQHQQQPPSFSSDFRGCNITGSNPENLDSLKTVCDGEVLDENGFASNEEKLHSGFQETQFEEAENYLRDSVFKAESDATHHEMENESSKSTREIALEKDPHLDELLHTLSRNSCGDAMSEKLFEEKLQQEGTPISHPDDAIRENFYDPQKSWSSSREFDPENLESVPRLSISPGTREMLNCASQSPESTTLQQQLEGRSYSGTSERRHSIYTGNEDSATPQMSSESTQHIIGPSGGYDTDCSDIDRSKSYSATSKRNRGSSSSFSPHKQHHEKRSMDIDPSALDSPGCKRTCYSPASDQYLKELPSSSRSCRHKHYSTGRSALGKEVASTDSILYTTRSNPDSSRELQQRFTGARLRHRPAPQVYRYLHLNKQMLEWPTPKSPPRRRVFSPGYKRDRHSMCQSKTPRVRDSHRCSIRHRSPPKHHFSNHAPQSKQHTSPHRHAARVTRPGRCLFVAGFCFKTTETDLERKFSKFGRVHDIRVIRDKRSGDSRGFGFLSLERDEEADEAIRALDRTEWKGRVILVEKSKTF